MSVVVDAVPSTVGEAVPWVAGRLAAGGISNGAVEAKELVARAVGVSRRSLDLRRDEPWPVASQAVLRSFLLQRLAHVPLAYLLGEWDFMDLTLTITPDVLIPRPETEELFQWLVRDVVGLGGGPLVLADVGTGAGGLALAMAREWPVARVTAVDLSSSALAVARWNAQRYGVERAIEFRRADLLEGARDAATDLIVANLPYVATSDILDLSPEVRKEPRGALDGGPDGLTLIRRLIPQAYAALKPGGRLFLEVGLGQAERGARAMTHAGFSEVAMARDGAGIHRFLRGVR